MGKIFKLLAILILLGGSVAAVNAFLPTTFTTLRDSAINQLNKMGWPKTDKKTSQNNQSSVLGENIDQEVKNFGGEFVGQVSQIPQQIMSQEIVSEATTNVNKIISDKLDQVKDIPAQEMKKIEKDIRKAIYKQICEQWSKE